MYKYKEKNETELKYVKRIKRQRLAYGRNHLKRMAPGSTYVRDLFIYTYTYTYTSKCVTLA